MTIQKYVAPSSIRRALKILSNAGYIKKPSTLKSDGTVDIFMNVPLEYTFPKVKIKKTKI